MFRFTRTFAAAGVIVSLSAAAQQPPGAGDLLREQRPAEPRITSPSTDPVLPQVAPPKPAPPATTRFEVMLKDFRFSGNTAFSQETLREVVRAFLGRTLDFDGLNDAANRVQRFYRERGYFLALAYLPRQEIKDGVVEIAVLEGRVGEINVQLNPSARLRESFARGIVGAHVEPGDLINERALERPLLLLRDLPDVEVSSELGPSKTQLGAADITVKLSQQPRWLTGYVDADNHGNRFSGEYRLGVEINSGDLTGYGDVLGFRGFATNEKMIFGRLSYVVPIGHHGARFGFSAGTFEYELGQDFADLQATGEGQVYNLYAVYPALRSRDANLYVQVGLERKDLEDRIESVGRVDERRIHLGKLGVSGDLRDRLFSGGLNYYSVTASMGKLDLAPEEEAIDQAPGTGPRTKGGFSKLNVELRRVQRLSHSTNVLLAYAGQMASKNLTSAEKFSLGGPRGVRAYPVGEAPGDSGHLFTAELRYTFPEVTIFGGNLTASLFGDHGEVRTLEEPAELDPTRFANKRSITGYGLGLSLGREGKFLVRAELAWPGDDETPQSDPRKLDPRLWVQAVQWF